MPAEAVPPIERINALLNNVQHSVSVQRRFIADAALQLRTPVAGMRVLLQALAQELGQGLGPVQAQAPLPVQVEAPFPVQAQAPFPVPAPTPGWQPLLEQLRGSGDRMARLIGQLLSLARSETELSMDAEHRAQNIVPLLREACEPLVLRALAAGRSVALDAPDSPVIARVHPIWLGEVLVNLLDNALRYGGDRISVQVSALTVLGLPAGAEVVVQDNGPGVDAAALARLFEPFWRGERADVRNDGGTGLGLTIAPEIVERLGGTLAVQSRPQADGLRFVIRLGP